MKILNLRADAILRKCVFDLTGNVAVYIAKSVNNKNEQNQRHDTNRRRNRRNKNIALVEKTTTPALRSYRMRTLGIAFSNCFRDRRKWFIRLRLEGLADLFLSTGRRSG